jgi:hypothetical protein
MIRNALVALLMLSPISPVIGLCNAVAQQPPDGDDAIAEYSFPIRSGGTRYRFKVLMDKATTFKGVVVFRGGSSDAVQTLTMCHQEMPEHLREYGSDLELVRHADLNFDGYEDLELLLWSNGHLEKQLYCIYLWDPATSRFFYSSDATDTLGGDPDPDPGRKTISTFNDFFGGEYESDTFQWVEHKLVRTSSISMKHSDSGSGCFTYSCSKLLMGKMVTTLQKQLCSQAEYGDPPDCPSAGAKKSASSQSK